MEMIEKYPEKPWIWDCISRNKFEMRTLRQKYIQDNFLEELVKDICVRIGLECY
jgi:hypothetical protein